MGFASYREDIVSRYDGSSRFHAKSRERSNIAPWSTQHMPTKTGEKVMSKLREFTVQSARPLPVILLADVSGSMGSEGKINALNLAVREMLEALKDESDLRAEIHVAVITFGGSARVHLPISPAKSAAWTDLGADGGTPMGGAFALARGLVEDRNTISSRAYRPTIVLVSDGQPTDDWSAPLKALLASERAGKAFRMAMAIGADADEKVLQDFLAAPEARVFRADEAKKIREFFRLVTMSVSSRSRSIDPNSPPPTAAGWNL